jgi:hypothetical protein
MGRLIRGLILLLVVGVATACAAAPPSRLSQYLGSDAASVQPDTRLPQQWPLRAGLVVLSDASAPDAAPVLPEDAVARVTEKLRDEISRGLPIAIDKIIPSEGLKPSGEIAPWADLGKTHGVDYVLVAVLSSTEQEYPVTVFLGWVTHAQPGYRRDNYSLVEVALIDVKGRRTILRSEGRGWATLDRPSAPGINQWYPVIYLRPQDPERRIWPPNFEGAPLTLRYVAMNLAAKRLVLNLQDAWLQKRQAELEAARS